MSRAVQYLDYVIEANIVALFLFFPFALKFFNNAWMALLIIYAISKLLRRESVALPASAPFLLLFGVAVAFSSTISDFGFGKTRYLFMGLGTCLFAYDWFSRDWERLPRVVFYFIISALLVSSTAIYQLLFGGLPIYERVEGPFRNTFYLALWSGTGLFLTIIILVKSGSRRTTQLCCYLAAIVLASAFILSKTRAPWVAMVLVIGVTCYFMPYRRAVLIMTGVLAVLFGSMVVFNESVRLRLLAVILNAGDLRWPIWWQTMQVIKEQFNLYDWILGRGPGAYSINLLYEGQIIKFAFPHFLPMELLYSLGICGTGIFLVWLGHLVYRTLMLLHGRTSWSMLDPVGMTAFLVLLTCLFNESFFARYFSFPFWFFSGISLALLNKRGSTGGKSLLPLEF